MITERSIELVRSQSITAVLGHYVKMDRNGKACCPFHDEKTPSFKVTEAKGIYKCFGCGESGDHISFVMKKEKLGFVEAIERIASLCGIQLEHEDVPDKEKYEQQKKTRDVMADVLNYTVTDYRAGLVALPADHPVIKYLQGRGITLDIIIEWQLGWATEDWQHLAPAIVKNGWYEPAKQLGIIKHSSTSDKNYDGYRSRIIFPICNRFGQYIGIAGRFFEIDPLDGQKNYPKYINPPQSDLYDKSRVLYGLSQAHKAIGESFKCYLVEGYTDVISMHAHGHANTVATCGTALTHQQAQLLKRFTSHVVIMRDGDSAGIKAAKRDLQVLLKEGMKVEICILPEGEDPDSYVQKHPLLDELPVQDGIFWQVNEWMNETSLEDPFSIGKVKENVLQLLVSIPNDIYRQQYLESISRKYKWKQNDLQKNLAAKLDLASEAEDDGEGKRINNLPKWMDKDFFEIHGYSAVKNKVRTGYYTHNGDKATELTNFIITPLFHVYAGKDSRYLIQIDNGKRNAVLDIESKALVNIDLLQSCVVSEGNFVIFGSKAQMLRIASNILESFPKCIPVRFLGWQREGFFAFVDKIFLPGQGIVELDEWGVYQHSDGEKFLVPAASAAYRELKKSGDDPYENERVLRYLPSAVTFEKWAVMMKRVYDSKGLVAVAYAILSMFRDIVFDIDNNCPHLYGFGERSSGKSKWAESITAIFYHKRAAYNLNSGTDFSFFHYMQIFINCPAALNEFDEKVIKPEWFQAIKGAFDGEGRQRGSMASKNRVEIMKIRSTLVLVGQYLCTMDDNSIVSRSIIEGFNEKEHTEDDKAAYDKLKRMEEAGLSNIVTEIVSLRSMVKEHYRTVFNQVLHRWRLSASVGESANIRILQNWCHLYTCWHLISQQKNMPDTNENFEQYCMKSAVKWSRFIRSSDTLSEFWNTISFLVDMGLIIEGWDYKIQTLTEVRIRKNRNEDYVHSFNQPTKVIFIRMNNVHKHYQQAYRTRTGKEGMTLENLEHYFSSRKYYVGANKQSRFKRFELKTENVTMPTIPGAPVISKPETTKKEVVLLTSSQVFLYDELGLEIEREEPEISSQSLNNEGQIPDPPDDADSGALPF